MNNVNTITISSMSSNDDSTYISTCERERERTENEMIPLCVILINRIPSTHIIGSQEEFSSKYSTFFLRINEDCFPTPLLCPAA